MRRREFITLIGGTAVTWPLAVYAQQAKQMSRIGVLYAGADTDPNYQARLAVFKQTLQQLGWNEGSNVTVDYRWCRRCRANTQIRDGIGRACA